jgi:L-ribulose-5-phosphate 4-epimerase
MLETLREEVRQAAAAMQKAGLVVGSDGNVSARDPETGHIAITPSGMPYDEIDADDFVIVDVDQNVIWGKRKPSWETPMHTYLHKHLPDVFAIMHTHSRYATMFAIAQRDIPAATMNLAAQFGGTVPCAPYARTGSEEMGSSNLEYLKVNQRGILLGNHGTLLVGPNLKKVLQLAEALEDGAKQVYEASLIGDPSPLPDEEIRWLFDLVNSFEEEEQKVKVG